EAIDELNPPVERFFQKQVDIDRGRLKVSKFQAKSGWILSCNFWPYSGGHSIITVCSEENQQG
uniref:Uncharacterized protein n=1 Tax=Cucumis melo TaxID=3656 RepID=A0A9I9EBY2_CUCME